MKRTHFSEWHRRAARWTFMIVVSALVAMVVLSGGSGSSHELTVVVPDATNVVAGQQIRAAGQVVGSIRGLRVLDGGRAAEMTLQFDGSVWPVPRSSQFALRWGGTAMYSNRYIAFTPGPSGSPGYHDGDRIPTSKFTTPVEFDQVLDTFGPRQRRQIGRFIDQAGPAFAEARGGIVRVLSGAAPAALAQANDVLADLDSRSSQLNTLIRAASDVTAAAEKANPGVSQLISGAAGTFHAVGAQADALKATLAGAPAVLVAARSTLTRARQTLEAASRLTSHLSPGVIQVRRLAQPLDATLQQLEVTGPDATSALSSVRRAAPNLNPLIKRVTGLAPEVGSIGTQAVTALKCIRPYTPDITAFFSDWGDWLSHVDGKDHYARLLVQFLLPAPANTLTENSGQAAKAFPGLTYAFPRPPGNAAGQSWLIPQCGVGPSALIPSDDPEARAFNPLEALTPFAPDSDADGTAG